MVDRFLHAVDHSVDLNELQRGSSLDCPREIFAGRSVLLGVPDQLRAALALLEINGLARRILLCPPDIQGEHIEAIIKTAEIDMAVTDSAVEIPCVQSVRSSPILRPAEPTRGIYPTEWVLLTSGTTGVPKLVVHSVVSLTSAIQPNSDTPTKPAIWSTFYDIRRYGGLQIFFRAVTGGGSLVLSDAREPVGQFLHRAGNHHVTNISGTPSHWRRALMSHPGYIHPNYIRLSGEIADQAILDDLQRAFPGTSVGHAFATTEAGVAFAVNDGLAGFPAGFIDDPSGVVELKIINDSLHIRSPGCASHYLGNQRLLDDDGFVDTGDILERRADRYYFVGRRQGIINVGGAKVHPEEVEAVINRHPAVQMSRVKGRKNPFTGHVVIAEVVVRPGWAVSSELQFSIIDSCRSVLVSHKVPAFIQFVDSLIVNDSGKVRRDA
jgi:acyl-coenzyme A synthetase/AMP-(fatty) acid ligase